MISRFSTITVKISVRNSVDTDILILKFVGRDRRPKTANIILTEKNESGHYLHYSTSRLTKKLKLSKQCGIDERIDKYTNGTAQKAQK